MAKQVITSVTVAKIRAAYELIAKVLPATPLTFSAALSELSGRKVYIKWDNRQRTGSFKERGAVNVLSRLRAEGAVKGVCAASAGNHALALSHHAARLKIPCQIVMPLSAPLVKIQATRSTGAQVQLFGSNFDEAYGHAIKLSRKLRYRFVSAFDDPLVIAGQGSAALEILNQLPSFDALIVPVGGGGLISGMAAAIKTLLPKTYILGVRSEWAMLARRSKPAPALAALHSSTIADGIAVKRDGKYTLPLMRRFVDDFYAASESQLASAIFRFLEFERSVVEGAGAAALAGLLHGRLPKRCKRVVLMVCGSNIDLNVLSRLIEREMAERSRLLRLVVSVPDRPGSLHATTGIIARSRGNVLEVLHDRSFSHRPGNVDITFMVEVEDEKHKSRIIANLSESGVQARKLL